MTNKKLTKKSKWLKLALISTASLTTLASIPAAICAKVAVKTSTPTLNTNLEVTQYHTVTFKLRQADVDVKPTATITGKVLVEVEDGMRFNTIKKPTASRFGYTFKGWSTNPTKPAEGEDTPIGPTDTISEDTTVYAIFVADSSVTIKGKTTVSLGEKNVKYTAVVTPAQTYKWYVTDKIDDISANPSSDYATIDNNGVLKPRTKTPEESKTYVFAWPTDVDLPSGFTGNEDNVLKIDIVNAWEDPDYAGKVITTIADEANEEEHTYAIETDEFYDDFDKMSMVEIGTDTTKSISKKTFNSPIWLGNNVTKIRDGFMPSTFEQDENGQWQGTAGFCGFNAKINLSHVQFIGAEFLAGHKTYTESIELPSTLLTIGKSFLDGAEGYNGEILFSGISRLFYIGDSFMDGCTSFAQEDLTLPESLEWVGESFLYNCSSLNNQTIKIHCPVHAFEPCDTSFAIDNNATHTKTFEIKIADLSDSQYDSLVVSFPNEGEKSDFARELVKAE